jgi:hypothetical protein
MTYPQQPPPGYATGPYGYPAYDGPPGRIRGTGVSVLLFVVTFGIYGYVYNYQVHDEMKRHSGRGIGGGVALLLTFLANVAMPFLTPHEVGNLYERKGQRPPVKAFVGLWTLVPMGAMYVAMIIGFVAAFGSLETDPATGDLQDPSTTGIATLVIAMLVGVAIWAAGAIIGFVKTNNALNQYWRSVGVS